MTNNQLDHAIREGDLDLVSKLLPEGADVNGTSAEYSPLHLASAGKLTDGHEAVYKKIVELLLGHGADANANIGRGLTPLHKAARRGYRGVVEVLLAHGADANAKHLGVTPLHWAAEEGNRDVVQLLLANGAEVNAAADAGRTTPLHWCVRGQSIGHKEVAELLLANNAYVDARNTHYGTTPLHDAAQACTAQLLLAHGADVNARSDGGTTPLGNHVGNAEVVEVLLASGRRDRWFWRSPGDADVNAADNYGETPLHGAAPTFSLAVVKLLLANRVRPNPRNKKGETPLYQALKMNSNKYVTWSEHHSKVIALLKKYGCKE